MLSLKPRPFVQSFFVLRCACVPTTTRVPYSFFLFSFGDIAFSEYFFVPLPFSLCMDSTSHVKKKGFVAFSLSPLHNMTCCARLQGT